MAETKRYYWLKLKQDFFDDEAIEWLESQKNGKEYALFYLKLCLRSIRDNGKLIRHVGEMVIPYDVQALANSTRTDLDTVVVAMKLLQQIGYVEVMDDGTFYMTQLEKMVGSETRWAEYKRKKKLENVQSLSNESPTQSLENVLQENKSNKSIRDKENKRIEDREINLDSKNTSSSFSSSLGEIKTKWESTFHPLMKAGDLETLDAYIQDYGRMGVINAIETAGKRKNLNRATLSPRYLLPILKNPTSKPEEPRRNVIPMITDRNEKEYWARLRREDEARQAEAKRLGEDDPYGIYGESS